MPSKASIMANRNGFIKGCDSYYRSIYLFSQNLQLFPLGLWFRRAKPRLNVQGGLRKGAEFKFKLNNDRLRIYETKFYCFPY